MQLKNVNASENGRKSGFLIDYFTNHGRMGELAGPVRVDHQ